MYEHAAIRRLSPELRNEIRNTVQLAMQYWPNAHLGDCSRREDMRSAFARIRRNTYANGFNIRAAIYRVQDDALNHADM